jgi:hypothetical protein
MRRCEQQSVFHKFTHRNAPLPPLVPQNSDEVEPGVLDLLNRRADEVL